MVNVLTDKTVIEWKWCGVNFLLLLLLLTHLKALITKKDIYFEYSRRLSFYRSKRNTLGFYNFYEK